MHHFLTKKNRLLIIILAVLAVPFFALAANDVAVSEDTNFELNTSDTAVLTTIIASAGGQVTDFDVQSNYIDITLDSTSVLTFTTTVSGQYLKITKQSGSSDYILNPACPTNIVTMTGTGATVILRLEVKMTNSCNVVTPPSGGGGGGGGGSSPSPINGSCGSADYGSYYYSAPMTNLCSAGTASTLVGSGPWVWTCAGAYGGATSPICTANKVPNLPVGCASTLGNSTITGLPCSGTIPTPPPTPVAVTPINTACSVYMTKYIKLDANNDSAEVVKLQTFLRDHEGFTNMAITGIYDQTTYEAVKVFQSRYAQDILIPWGSNTPTGWVYQTTIKKINEIYCAKTSTVLAPATPVIQPQMSTCQFVELLVNIGVISFEKANPARSALNCSAIQSTPTVPVVIPCGQYMTGYIKLGANNDADQVKKLQSFLIQYEDFSNLQITGIYTKQDYDAVVRFQEKYADDILTPWGDTVGSGYVYKTTLYKINKIVCDAGVDKPVLETLAQPAPTILPTIPVVFPAYILSATSTSNVIKYQFTKDLETGMIAEDVYELQRFLNNNGYILTNTGAGSPGNETNRFGALTREALIRYQNDNSIFPAQGYFGPLTRLRINRN